MMNPYVERSKKILTMLLGGKNMQEIADLRGVTRQRIHACLTLEHRKLWAEYRAQKAQERAQLKAEKAAQRAARRWRNKPADRFWEHVKKGDGCWEWQLAYSAYGYGHLMWGNQDEYAHRIAWELSNDSKIPDGMFVCHTCDNPPCCNPDHLFLGTPADNSRDSVKKGRWSKQPRALSDEQILEARQLHQGGMLQTEIAQRFHVSDCTISKAINHKNAYRDC
jgi:predicted DNA-binding protein YlxM (UPF0122 family)